MRTLAIIIASFAIAAVSPIMAVAIFVEALVVVIPLTMLNPSVIQQFATAQLIEDLFTAIKA